VRYSHGVTALAGIVEHVARDAIDQILDPLRIERLHPDGQGGTGDWRATLTNGRVADIEVTSHTNPDGNNFWSQIHHKPGPEWPDHRLAYKWTVLISDPEPEANKRRTVRRLVDALIPVLVSAEAASTTCKGMAEIANRRLVSVLEFTKGSDWDSQWANEAVAMTRKGVSFEEWVPLWAKRSGFWYPQLLIDHFDDPAVARRVSVVKPPEPADKGMVYTLAGMGGGVTLGDWEALSTAIQECINHKAGKDQLANAPDLKWLVVGLDGGHAASQLTGHFGPKADPPYSFEPLNGLTFACFDDVWAMAPCGDGTYTVLRLAERSRHIVRSSASESM